MPEEVCLLKMYIITPTDFSQIKQGICNEFKIMHFEYSIFFWWLPSENIKIVLKVRSDNNRTSVTW